MLAEKRYIWHPMLKEKAVEDRLYQNRILERARQCNTLVVLPTALGKTVIALLLGIEKAEEGKIFFLAPTRPLVQQHPKYSWTKRGLTREN
jgi:ERCC4-related helicase